MLVCGARVWCVQYTGPFNLPSTPLFNDFCAKLVSRSVPVGAVLCALVTLDERCVEAAQRVALFGSRRVSCKSARV